MDIHKYKFVTVVNDVKASLSWITTNRAVCHGEEYPSTPDTLTTLWARRKVLKRARARARYNAYV